MKIYLDLVLFLNFAFDGILLLCVSILLRRLVKFRRILLGAFIGSLSTLFLFLNINSLELFLLKVIISVFMIIICFGFRNIKYFGTNLFYLYITSIVLGGFLYYLNVEFSYMQQGLVFFHKGLSINYIFLIIFAPIILYIYVKQVIKLKENYSNYHKVSIYKDNKSINCTGFLDTGNKLFDPYKKRPILLLDKRKINFNIDEYIYVPYAALNYSGLLKCFKVDYIEVDGEKKYNFLLGIMEDKINIDGVDMILNQKLWEE